MRCYGPTAPPGEDPRPLFEHHAYWKNTEFDLREKLRIESSSRPPPFLKIPPQKLARESDKPG